MSKYSPKVMNAKLTYNYRLASSAWKRKSSMPRQKRVSSISRRWRSKRHWTRLRMLKTQNKLSWRPGEINMSSTVVNSQAIH